MLLVTTASIMGLLSLAFDFYYFSAGEYKDFCTYDINYIYWPGLAGLLFGLFLSLICMW
jgi:hypothetical protein